MLPRLARGRHSRDRGEKAQRGFLDLLAELVEAVGELVFEGHLRSFTVMTRLTNAVPWQ